MRLLHALPLPIHRTFRRRLAGVQVVEASRPDLVAGSDGVLLAGLLVAVPGQDAGVVGALFGQVGYVVAIRQLRLQVEAGGEALRGERVPQVAAQPDDGRDFRLDTGEGVRLVG